MTSVLKPTSTMALDIRLAKRQSQKQTDPNITAPARTFSSYLKKDASDPIGRVSPTTTMEDF